jgi:hypothetical protein
MVVEVGMTGCAARSAQTVTSPESRRIPSTPMLQGVLLYT